MQTQYQQMVAAIVINFTVIKTNILLALMTFHFQELNGKKEKKCQEPLSD